MRVLKFYDNRGNVFNTRRELIWNNFLNIILRRKKKTTEMNIVFINEHQNEIDIIKEVPVTTTETHESVTTNMESLETISVSPEVLIKLEDSATELMENPFVRKVVNGHIPKSSALNYRDGIVY